MDNCYGKGDRIPRELLHNKDDRLTNKHIQTLSFLQEIAHENKQLRERLAELENEREKCKEIHALAEDSQNRIKEIQEQHIQQADGVNQMLADQHRSEMMQVLDEKMEMERSLKEEILKLRHEVESLQRANVDIKEDSEWLEEQKNVQGQISEKELLVEGLQIEVNDMTSKINSLKKSLQEAQAKTSELHQLQNLQTINQSLKDELKETHQKNQEYLYKIEKLQRELNDNSTEKEYTKLVEALENKMGKLTKEKELAEMMAADAELQYEEMQALNDALQNRINKLELEYTTALREFEDLSSQYNRLSRRLHQGEEKAAFKEFVAVKRELDAMKEENELMQQKLKMSSHSLPQLKEHLPPQETRVTSQKGKKTEHALKLAKERGPFSA